MQRLQHRTVGTEREQIVFGRAIDWDEEAVGGVVKISPFGPLDHGIDPETARELLEKGYLQHGWGHEAMIEFGERIVENHESRLCVVLTGYMVSPYRGDARVTLDGITLGVTQLADLYANAEIPQSVADEFRREFFPADARVDEPTVMSAGWD